MPPIIRPENGEFWHQVRRWKSMGIPGITWPWPGLEISADDDFGMTIMNLKSSRYQLDLGKL